MFQTLFEKISRSFQFFPAIALDELVQIYIPNVVNQRPPEKTYSFFERLKGILKVFVVFQIAGVVDDYLRGRNSEVENSFVDGLTRVNCSARFLKVRVK
jgi:hypothetical protein